MNQSASLSVDSSSLLFSSMTPCLCRSPRDSKTISLSLMGFYKSLYLPIVRHLFYTPIRIIGYENLKGIIVSSKANNGESLPLAIKALLGGFSCVIAQVVASPADLVKVRMQPDGRLVSQGLKPRYSGPVEAFTRILQSEGVKGLWKGVVPNIHRAFLVNMGELACYDQTLCDWEKYFG